MSYYDDEGYLHYFAIDEDGSLIERPSSAGTYDPLEKGRPVINIRADVPFTGNGSFETPYVITTN